MVSGSSDNVQRVRAKRASRVFLDSPLHTGAAKSLVVSVKRGAESAPFCGACQMSRSDRAGLVDVVLMNGRVDVHASMAGLKGTSVRRSGCRTQLP